MDAGTALLQARLTGRPVPVGNVPGLFAKPDGTVGPMGSGFAAPPAPTQPSWWQQALAPFSGPDLGLNVGTPTLPEITVTAQRPPPVMNQVNPNTIYVSPNTPQPTGAAPVVGQTGTQSGPSVAPTYNMPPAPDPVVAARNYRQAHGLATAADNSADALNAQSLAAAQAGRNYWDPTLNIQPGGNVLNALVTPPAANQLVAAS